MLVEDPAGSIPSLKDCVSEDSENVLRLLAALGNGTKFPVILHDPVERGLNTSLQKYNMIKIHDTENFWSERKFSWLCFCIKNNSYMKRSQTNY